MAIKIEKVDTVQELVSTVDSILAQGSETGNFEEAKRNLRELLNANGSELALTPGHWPC